MVKEIKDRKHILNGLKILIIILTIILINNVVVNAADDTVISKENWSDWQEKDYWEWYTRTTTDDKAYNGEHIVIQNDVIDFYGYGQISYKDFLYKEYKNAGRKIFKFTLDETMANYHTLDGAGFIFNASKVNNKLSGYVVLFKETEIALYRLDNIDIDTFGSTSETTLETYGEIIQKKNKSNSTLRNLVIEATPTNIKITEAEEEILNVNLDYSKHVGESFGLISSYVQHDCEQLTKIEFSQISIILEDYNISAVNTNLEDTPIQGGYFELKNEKGEIVKEGKTDKNGIFSVEGIKAGIYTIQQKTPPENYILNDTVYKFEVTSEGKVVDVDTGEEIKLKIQNKKIESENNTNNDNKNNSKNDSKDIDNTKSDIPIPNAGEKTKIICIIIAVFIVLNIYLFIKLKEYRIVK